MLLTFNLSENLSCPAWKKPAANFMSATFSQCIHKCMHNMYIKNYLIQVDKITKHPKTSQYDGSVHENELTEVSC